MSADFDRNECYEEQLAPIVGEIRRICNENHIPCFLAFGTKMEGGRFLRGEGVRCTALLPQVLGIQTDDSYFAEFVNVMNGAKTTYFQQDILEEDADDAVISDSLEELAKEFSF